MVHSVKIMGRYALVAGEIWMASSLCEVSFLVRDARFLRLRLKADDTVVDPARKHLTPRYGIRVNGKLIRDAHLTQKEEVISVFEAPQEGETEVQLIKLSECTQSLMALAEVQTDGMIRPRLDRAQRIAFIGDSITCGYGVEATDPLENFSTFTENAEKSYAGLLSDALGVDRELVSMSGHGIVSGYTGDPAQRNETELVPPYYDKVGRNEFILPDGRRLQEIPWDFSLFQPQRIVINLGTNDLSWCQEQEDRKALFREKYAEFLKTVREGNPQAEIFCILGVMGTGLNEMVHAAVADYQQESLDQHIQTLLLPEQEGEQDGFGANFHPSEITQRKLAETLKSFLEKG